MGHSGTGLPGRSGGVPGARCTSCGEPVPGGAAVTVVLREIVYEYCDGDCRDRHAAAVALTPAGCDLCDDDAVGDTGRCAVHLGGGTAEGTGGYPLAG